MQNFVGLIRLKREDEALKALDLVSDQNLNLRFKISEDHNNLTALHFACWHGLSDVVRGLIIRECNVKVYTKKRLSPMHYACYQDGPSLNLDIFKLLHKADADLIHDEDNIGRTPLHYAAEFGMLELVNLLLDFGANPTAKDKHGNTADSLTKNLEILSAIRQKLSLQGLVASFAALNLFLEDVPPHLKEMVSLCDTKDPRFVKTFYCERRQAEYRGNNNASSTLGAHIKPAKEKLAYRK